MKQIGINGFGRIGRYFTRLALSQNDINIAVVNDLADIKTLAHLLKYDSIHGKLPLSFSIFDNKIIFENGKEIIFIKEKNPEQIPWGSYNVEIVLESTGLFLTNEEAGKHLKGGAKKVIISAPSKTEDVKTVVLGVNDNLLTEDDVIISNASCTTNSAAPLIKVMLELCEIESAFINTFDVSAIAIGPANIPIKKSTATTTARDSTLVFPVSSNGCKHNHVLASAIILHALISKNSLLCVPSVSKNFQRWFI